MLRAGGVCGIIGSIIEAFLTSSGVDAGMNITLVVAATVRYSNPQRSRLERAGHRKLKHRLGPSMLRCCSGKMDELLVTFRPRLFDPELL